MFVKGEEIIGLTYGTILEKKGQKAIVKPEYYTLDQDMHSLELDTEITKDNREIFDEGQNQKLSYEEIEYRKSIGVRGQELINNIVENSETFAKRTKFSKEKYLKKLKKKHLNLLELRYPSMHNICDFVYEQPDNKAIKLRYDTLGYILNSANISCTSTTLVIENTRGILTACVVERMGETGKIVKFSLPEGESNNPNGEIMHLNKLCNVVGKNIDFINYRQLKKKTEESIVLREKLNQTCTSCIIVHDKHSPVDLFNIVYPYLQYSCYVTVHSHFIQPLAELEKHLNDMGLAVMINLESLFTREHQILPSRTHPHMVTTNNGGYILTFITIEPGR